MTADCEPLVSVVTPVYNEERYLARCIESVLGQSYANWQYTIVNNCSTDRTLEIATRYAERDARIRIHNNRTFVSGRENFNLALLQTSRASQYCKMIGGDDWIYPNCLEEMVKIGESHPTVAIIGAYWLNGDDNGPGDPAPMGMPLGATLVSGRQICRSFLLGGPYQFGTPTTVMYRSDIVHSRDRFFDVTVESQDVHACLEFLQDRDYGFAPQILTFNRVRDGSLYAEARMIGESYFRDLKCLQIFGPIYLSEAELRERFKRCLRRYLKYLGSRFYDRVGREFWELHYNNLRMFDCRFGKARLTGNAAVYALEAALRRLRRAVAGSQLPG